MGLKPPTRLPHVKWSELCSSEEFRGHWVALDQCRYDELTARPVEGDLVDADEDVVELCNRVRDAEFRDCAILFIEEQQKRALH